jgi:hypothetical protein
MTNTFKYGGFIAAARAAQDATPSEPRRRPAGARHVTS